MGILSRFEGKMEDAFEGSLDIVSNAPISPVQIAKKAEKQMKREKMVGAGKQYAPTLYTVLVNPDDDQRLFGYYPTLAGETETYLAAKANEQGLVMDGQPLVRFIVDDGLKHGKFDVIAEAVASPIIEQLRAEEMDRYGLGSSGGRGAAPAAQQQPYGAAPAQPYSAPAAQQQPYGAAPAAGGAAYGGQNPYAQPAPNPYAAAQAGQPAPQADRPQPQPAQPEPAAQAGQPDQKPPLPYVPQDEIDYSIDYGEYTFDSRDFNEDDNDAAAAPAAAHAAATPATPAAAPAPDAAPVNPAPAAQPAATPVPSTVAFVGSAQDAAAGAPSAYGAAPAYGVARARLIDTTNNRSYDLGSACVTIGRESKNDISVADINASRQHAELRQDPQGAWFITDLGSTNGTFVNDRAVASQMLSEGDHITIGVTNFVFTQA